MITLIDGRAAKGCQDQLFRVYVGNWSSFTVWDGGQTRDGDWPDGAGARDMYILLNNNQNFVNCHIEGFWWAEVSTVGWQ